MDVLVAIVRGMGHIVLENLPQTLVFAVLFTLLGIFATACNPDAKPWYKKPDALP